MYNLLETIRICARAADRPSCPRACDEALRPDRRVTRPAGPGRAPPHGAPCPPTATVTKGENLFPRIDAEKALAELEAAAEAAKKAALPAVEVEPQTEEKVDFDTFCKSDFRAVKVKDCEPVKKSDKLLCFTLDDGTGTDRQILSGIAALLQARGTDRQDPGGHRQPAAPQDDGQGEQRHADLRRPHRARRGEAPPASWWTTPSPPAQSWADPISKQNRPAFRGMQGGFCTAVIYLPSRSATTRATLMPEAPACARPRVVPAPSPMAKKFFIGVSSSLDSSMRLE